jgi:hypothetical protein
MEGIKALRKNKYTVRRQGNKNRAGFMGEESMRIIGAPGESVNE